MSTPVVERTRGTARTGTKPARRTPVIPAQRGAGAQQGHAQQGGHTQKGHAQKAYAKRDERLRRLVGAARPARSGTPRRAQFVLLVMVLLGTGLVLTLWLSTAAAADSYRLQDARAAAGTLGERSEQLRREVAVLGSATEIARRAAEMGMVGVQDPARVVVAEDGSATVVGEPQAARAPAPPPPPVVAAPPAPVDGAEVAPVEGAPAGDVPAGDVPADGPPVEDGAELPVDEAPTADAAAPDAAAPDAAAPDAAAAAPDQPVSDPAVSDPAASN